MRNVMKYLGIMSVSLACAGPLFATSVQPFAGVTVVQQSVVTVKGQVVDEKGEPIIGANVIVEGTTNGMITDLDGNFSLQCPVGSTLKTSYIGYLARTVKVTGNMNALKITLKEDTETLDEVVVVGYGTMKKSDLTGSVASVNAEEMMKRNPVNLGQGLQGAAAGVSVIRSSGDPEGGFSIRIRGVATVNGSADPLYVVDGVQVGTSIDFLNPNDVESIEILKDASATAIYGTRGANGVIMITTKNGGKGKAKVNFSANYALQFNSNKIDVADAGLFASAVRSAVKNDGIAMTNLAYGEDYIGRLNSIDWQDEMSRTALQQNYNLSASGGSENTQANLSLGYLNNQGIVIESNFKRLTARANITHKVKDFLHVGLNLNYAHSEKMGGGNLRNYAQAIPTMDYVEDGVFYSMPIVLPDGTWGHYKKEGNGDVNKGADNLVAAAKTADSINKWDRLLASAFLQLDLYKGLTFKTIASYNYYTKGYNGYTAYNDRTFGTQDRKDSFSLNQSQSTSLGLEAFLNYDWSNEHHRVSAMAGFSTSDTNGAWLNSSANDFPADGWDAEWQRHAWKPDKGSLETAWRMSYRAVDRANRFLAGLETADASIFADSNSKTVYEAQARAIRGYNYLYLTKLFGRVPMLFTGETYTTSVGKARPESVDETYAAIEEDLSFGRDHLDWLPMNGEYGRITKGFCKAYLAELYMLKKDFTKAKTELKDIVDSGTYSLEPCFGNLHAWDTHWTKESVFEVMYHEQGYMGWGADSSSDAMMWYGYMCAAPEWGGWGSLCLSWEFVRSFEPGDKRRQYSAVAKGDTHPITGQTVGVTSGFDGLFQGSENMPTVYSLKYWRCKPGENNKVFNPISLTLKRYAGIMLDYAECCFETGDNATGWNMIRQIRNRAWGNLEMGATMIDLPADMLNTQTVEVPDAETYYTSYKAAKGYTSPVWKVALIIERRHEFNAEFSLYHDLCRMGMCKEWFAAEYPKTVANSSQEACLQTGDSFRFFEHEAYQEIFPIPTNEILTNPL